MKCWEFNITATSVEQRGRMNGAVTVTMTVRTAEQQ